MENEIVIFTENKQKLGVSIPTRLENTIRRNVSISLSPGEAMRSLETSPI